VQLATEEPVHTFDAASGHRVESEATAREKVGA
jgi:hypothetical protein